MLPLFVVAFSTFFMFVLVFPYTNPKVPRRRHQVSVWQEPACRCRREVGQSNVGWSANCSFCTMAAEVGFTTTTNEVSGSRRSRAVRQEGNSNRRSLARRRLSRRSRDSVGSLASFRRCGVLVLERVSDTVSLGLLVPRYQRGKRSLSIRTRTVGTSQRGNTHVQAGFILTALHSALRPQLFRLLCLGRLDRTLLAGLKDVIRKIETAYLVGIQDTGLVEVTYFLVWIMRTELLISS